MNKLIKKLRKKVNNSGSSIVLVVVGLGFIGVLVGALLTAAGYALRQKVYNYNSKDNFFYLEQAMDEVYAGVGQETMDALKSAYDETVNEVVYYDTKTKSYVAKDNEVANKEFKTKFMEKVYTNPVFDSTKIEDYLNSLISNESVKVDKTPIIKVYDKDGNLYAPGATITTVSKVSISGVVLSRKVDYQRSNVNSSFTQTISTDIDISQPNFKVKFGSTAVDLSNVFSYAMIAGNGVEVNEKLTGNKTFTVNGNIYAAADYYNKGYATNNNLKGNDYDYVYSKISDGSEDNAVKYKINATVHDDYLKYKGDTEKSAYSGFYVGGSDVALMSDLVVVPGTIAVMDNGSISIYSKNSTGQGVGDSRVWCDDFVLGGESLANDDGTYSGSSALVKAKLFIQDDLQLDANGSYFSMNGAYIGYNNSTLTNLREYTDEVNKDFFSIIKGKNKEERGHINSSSIAINGRKSQLDFSSTKKLYLAGRDYIEHSKRTAIDTTKKKVYYYDTNIDDYKTGESIAVKSNQLAYIPNDYGGIVYMLDRNSNGVYNEGVDAYVVSLTKPFTASELFREHFTPMSFGPSGLHGGSLYPVDLSVRPKNGTADGLGQKVTEDVKNCVLVQLKTINISSDPANKDSFKNFVYYDFDANFNVTKQNGTDTSEAGKERKSNATYAWTYYTKNNITSGDDLVKDFIVCYADVLVKGSSATATPSEKELYEALVDISEYDGYTTDKDDIVKYIEDDYTKLDKMEDYFASGALTYTDVSSFKMVTASDQFLSADHDYAIIPITETFGNPAEASDIAENINKRYEYLKFSLEELNPLSATDLPKTTAIDTILAKDGGKAHYAISPINTYFNFDQLTNNTLSMNGYVVISSKEKDLVLTDNVDGVKDKTVRGIIFTSGRVTFSPDVEKFEGLIVAGDKIIFPEDGLTTNVNANAEMCKQILKELQFSSSDKAASFLKIFKGYESVVVKKPEEVTSENQIQYLDYSSVVQYSNWMKNVTDYYGK